MRRRRVGRPGLVGTMTRTAVVAGTATAVSRGVSNSMENKQQAKAQQQAAEQQAAVDQAPAQAPPPAPAPAADGLTDDKIQQLQKLGELKSAGVLTDEEFAAAKAKILGI